MFEETLNVINNSKIFILFYDVTCEIFKQENVRTIKTTIVAKEIYSSDDDDLSKEKIFLTNRCDRIGANTIYKIKQFLNKSVEFEYLKNVFVFNDFNIIDDFFQDAINSLRQSICLDFQIQSNQAIFFEKKAFKNYLTLHIVKQFYDYVFYKKIEKKKSVLSAQDFYVFKEKYLKKKFKTKSFVTAADLPSKTSPTKDFRLLKLYTLLFIVLITTIILMR